MIEALKFWALKAVGEAIGSLFVLAGMAAILGVGYFLVKLIKKK